MLVQQDVVAPLVRLYGHTHQRSYTAVIDMSLRRGAWMGLVQAWEEITGEEWPYKTVKGWLDQNLPRESASSGSE